MKTASTTLAIICIALTFATDGTPYMPSFIMAAGFSSFVAIYLATEKKKRNAPVTLLKNNIMTIEKLKELGFKKEDSHSYVKKLNGYWSISVDFWHNRNCELVFSGTLYVDGDTFTGIDSHDDMVSLATGKIDPEEYYGSMA